jgi:hypothetical protein
MNILENPFYILGATPKDPRHRIMELADEKSLSIEQGICNEAMLLLTNPRRRVKAEISWFVEDCDFKYWIDAIKSSNIEVDELIEKIENEQEVSSPLNSFNIILSSLKYLVTIIKTNDKMAEIIWLLGFDFENISAPVDIEDIMDFINENRKIANFPQITDVKIIEEELENHKNFCLKEIGDILKSNYNLNSITNIMNLVLKYDDNLFLVNELIDKFYTIEIQNELEIKKKKVEEFFEIIKTNHSREIVKSLIQSLKEYDDLVQPIQVSMQNRGLEHKESRDIAHKARSVAIDLYNNFKELELSKELMETVNKLFIEIRSVKNITDKDLATLVEEEREKTKYSFSVEKGFWIFKTKISISQSGIYYNNLFYDIYSIVGIRYGATRKYTNGIYTGTTTLIGIKDSNNNSLTITHLNEEEFDKFTKCLWHLVGIRLILKMIKELKEGKIIDVRSGYGGSMFKMSLNGIYIIEYKSLFSKGKEVFHTWNSLNVYSKSGKLCIATTYTIAIMYYIDDENAHIIDAVIKYIKNNNI